MSIDQSTFPPRTHPAQDRFDFCPWLFWHELNAEQQLDRALKGWQDGAGFSFALEIGDDARRTSGLQGTEMWLSIIWLLADMCGESAALAYRPLGVHRPEPAFRIEN